MEHKVYSSVEVDNELGLAPNGLKLLSMPALNPEDIAGLTICVRFKYDVSLSLCQISQELWHVEVVCSSSFCQSLALTQLSQ